MAEKEEIRKMFDNVSKHYDFLNHFLSMNIDKSWRRKVIAIHKTYNPKQIVDLATGTADLAIAAIELNPDKITGIDISSKMLEIGRKKIESLGLTDKIELINADGENIPFGDNKFDAATIAFGIRNYAEPQKGLKEIYRVLNYDGLLTVLEFSKPTVFPFNLIYRFYFKVMLPVIGRLVSKSKNAYTYLPESVYAFPDGNSFLKLMQEAGFKETKQQKLTFGIASIYTGKKKWDADYYNNYDSSPTLSQTNN